MFSYSLLIAPPLFMFAASATYFFASSTALPLWKRLLLSSHGAIAGLLMILGLVITATGNAHPDWVAPYLSSFIVPIAAHIVAIARFTGNRKVHMLFFPFLIVVLLWAMSAAPLVSG